MITQSSRFSIGHRSDETSVQALKYSTLPTSPQAASKHSAKKTVAILQTPGKGSGKHVFIPQKDDTVKQRFRLRYSPCSDAYHRELEDSVLTRVGRNIRGWETGVYSYESVERIVDTKKNLVYLERTPGSNTGILTWKIDFVPCGLVVDQLSIKVESHCLSGGDVLVTLASGDIKKTISHMEGLGLVNVKEFQNAKDLVLSVHLIGETCEQETRLFEKNILSKDEFPLDLKVALKPPTEMYNKPIILLGLMFSNSQETTVDRRHYRSHSNSAGRGFLHINIVQGKNITHTKEGLPDPQVKCYLLPDTKNIKSCKTKRAQKSSSPIWDEYFVIDGVSQSQLRKQQLGIRVVNWHIGINKKNALLGELRVGCRNVFDFHSLASPIITSSDRQSNERVVYSPLVQTNNARERNGRPSSDAAIESRGLQSSNEYNEVTKSSTKRSLTQQNAGNSMWSNSETKVDPLVQNLNVTAICDEEHENSSDISINISKFDQATGPIVSDSTNNSSQNDNNNQKISEGNELRESKVKPPRPPPPTRLNLADGQLSPSGNLSPRCCQSNPQTPDTIQKVMTPTFSRLMSSLPISPKRGRRLSWGGESDLSLESPRSTKSPTDQQSLQSGQWDIMISKPKQWIYCWQMLVVSVSE